MYGNVCPSLSYKLMLPIRRRELKSFRFHHSLTPMESFQTGTKGVCVCLLPSFLHLTALWPAASFPWNNITPFLTSSSVKISLLTFLLLYFVLRKILPLPAICKAFKKQQILRSCLQIRNQPRCSIVQGCHGEPYPFLQCFEPTYWKL